MMKSSLNSTTPPTKTQTPIDGHTNEEEATTTISCSSDVSQSRILGDLMHARSVQHISNITLKELVRSKHHCLMPLVKALAASSTRTWESFRFEDAVELADFEAWQVLRDDMMEDYEQTSYEREEEDGSTSFLHVMTWQANVNIPGGTPVQDIVRFLRRVQSDDEVYQVAFGGALGDMFSVLVPDVLGTFIDKQNFVLERDIVVEVACGWREEDDNDWIELLDDCVASLRERLPVSHLSLKKRWDASTCSISSYSESFMGSAGNLSLKSFGTSYTGYASFYDESCFEASHNGLHGAGEGNATWSSTKNSSLSLANAFYGEASINSLGGSSAQLFPGNGVPKAA